MGKLLTLIFPVVLIVMGIQFSRDYFGDTTKDQRNKLEQLIANGESTTATLSSEYKTKKIKIAKVPIKMHEFDYSFNVGTKEYQGKKTYTAQLPASSAVNVKYLADDPSVNAIAPAEALASLEETSGTPSLLIGLGMILVGGFLGYRRLKA